jgi:phosphoglycolate phosphatase
VLFSPFLLFITICACLFFGYVFYNLIYRKPQTTQRWVIFDFDGTIADSFLFVVDSVNHWATWYGYPPIREDELNRLRHYSMHNLVANRLGISWYQRPLFHYLIKRTLLNYAATAKPCHGIAHEISALKNAGYKLAIVSSNSRRFISSFFKKHDLPIFDTIKEASVFGKHRAIKKCLRHNGINPEFAIYVGDEARDIEAAKKVPLAMIAVSWGGSSASLLLRHMPTAIIHQPDALTPLITAMMPLGKDNNR